MATFAGSAGILRLCALVDHPAHHTAPVHLPSVPQCRDTCRDLEDHLQGTPGVRWHVAGTYILEEALRDADADVRELYENAPKPKCSEPKKNAKTEIK